MKKSNLRVKKLAFSIVLVLGWLFPMTIFAQQNDGFFRGGNDNYANRDATTIPIYDEGGISNYGIGESVPLGSGLLILTAVGAGYAVLRRKKSTKLLLALALLLGMTQCKKNTETMSNPAENKVFITLDVCGNDGSKVVVTPGYENPETHEIYANVEYENGDKIYVGYNNAYVGELTFNSTNNRFEGEVSIAAPVGEQPLHFYLLGGKGFTPSFDGNTATVVISDQSSQYPVISYYHSNEPYTGTGKYTSKLRNKCSIMKFNVVTPSSSPICIMGMNNMVTVDFSNPGGTDNGFLYSKYQNIGEIKMHSTTVGSGTSQSPYEMWAIVLPQAALLAGVNEAYTSITEVMTSNEDYLTGSRCAIPAISSNEYLSDATNRTITVNETPKFSVSSTQKVLFSPGNLQATTNDGWSTYSWSFMEHQYSLVESNGSIAANRAGETAISLFKWAANGKGDGEAPNTTNAKNSKVKADLEGETDWGSCISDGFTWRTPSKNDWKYVLFDRIVATDKDAWGMAIVKNVKGLIILPDNWNGAIDPNFVYGDDYGGNNEYGDNTTIKWSEMEAAGVVFLPANGFIESTVQEVNEGGCYWASTYKGEVIIDENHKSTSAYCMYFGYDYPEDMSDEEDATVYSDWTHYGSGVRLIRNVE